MPDREEVDAGSGASGCQAGVAVAPRMVRGAEDTPRPSALDRAQRWRALGLRGATVWCTGLPASGKSTLAARVEERLIAAGRPAYVLDGDSVRKGLCCDLGFERAERDENVRRVGETACLFADAGVIALVALVSPFRDQRRQVRDLHERAGLCFLEVWLNTPVQECAQRDPKGLYRLAHAGGLRGLTGVDDPYEPPVAPDLEVARCSPAQASDAVLALLGQP